MALPHDYAGGDSCCIAFGADTQVVLRTADQGLALYKLMARPTTTGVMNGEVIEKCKSQEDNVLALKIWFG